MKIKDLEIGKEVVINALAYQYRGVKKVKILTEGAQQKIVFERNNGDHYDYKYFDLPVGNKELKETNGVLEMK